MTKPFAAFVAGVLLLAGQCHAQVFGTVDALSGNAILTGLDGSRSPVAIGTKILRGQMVSTGIETELHAVTEDGGFIALRPNSLFQVTQYRVSKDSSAVLDMSLLRGAMRSITGWIGKINPGGYRLATATATIGIRGTDHETTIVDVDAGRDRAGTFEYVHEGGTVMQTAAGEFSVEAGQHGFAARDGAQTPRLLDQSPDFFANRQLRLENRIQQQKEVLGRRIQQVLDERVGRSGERGERPDRLSEDQREAVKKNLRRKLQQRKVN